jgi:hypothetical protein
MPSNEPGPPPGTSLSYITKNLDHLLFRFRYIIHLATYNYNGVKMAPDPLSMECYKQKSMKLKLEMGLHGNEAL